MAIRILHVISSVNPEGGGPIEGVRQRGAVLREMGHEIEIACCDGPQSAWLVDFPFKVYALGPARGVYGYAPLLRDWLRDNAGSYDGVVVNGIWQYHSRAVSRVMSALHRPYVVFTHGMLDPWFKRTFPLKHIKKVIYWNLAERKVLHNASAVLFTSEEERLEARKSFTRYQVKERVVNYGTSGPTGDPTDQRAEFFKRWPELEGTRILLYLSRIHPKKGCDLLLHGFADVCGQNENLRLVMAGPDRVGWQPELERLASDLGISEKVVWAGMLSGDMKWGAYHACDAFVLPSHQENFGIVVAEALACGKPALISNKVNIWREVEAALAGLVADDTKEGVREMLSKWMALTTDEWKDMGIRAVECFEGNFEIHASALSLLRVLGEVAS